MKSYLCLIAISAKARRRQSRMTILCIVLAVLMVTAIFSMADMMIRTETNMMGDKHGVWHLALAGLTEEQAQVFAAREDVDTLGECAAFNVDADKPYFIGEKRAALYGTDAAYLGDLMNGMTEGAFPSGDGEVVLTPGAKTVLGVEIGGSVTIRTPMGDYAFTVSGFGTDDASYYRGQTFMVGVYMTKAAFDAVMAQNGEAVSPTFYARFKTAALAAKAEKTLDFGDISENTAIMGLAMQSASRSARNLYGVAAVLFALVLLAGVLMISGSMNSSVAQRTRFFGMLRCIGASRSQITKLVTLEALSWCKTAVPLGAVLGTLTSWGLCALLHYGIGGEFETMPVFALSPVGLACGALVGVLTVLLAARAPARRAAKVSPMAAVSGNAQSVPVAARGASLGALPVETALGVRHATAAKKNWAMMTASFTLTILLMLCFSAAMDFARELMPSLMPWTPDATIVGYANANIIPESMAQAIEGLPGVTRVNRMNLAEDVTVTLADGRTCSVKVVSYSDSMLERSKTITAAGDTFSVLGSSGNAATIYNRDNALHVGDSVRIGDQTLSVTCAYSRGLFADEDTLIVSQETFDRLMGARDYVMLGLELEDSVSDDVLRAIDGLITDNMIFSDNRESNRTDMSSYWAVRLMGYGFLGMIALISFSGIVNSMAMSAAARMKQYGAMRAVGMDGGQLTRMLLSEAMTYALSGLTFGFALGVPLSRAVYERLITYYFGMPWAVPTGELLGLAAFVLLAALVSTVGPAKRIREMAVTETISEL